MKTNRQIDNLILSEDWHIDEAWGLSQLGNYLAELDAIESGVKIDYAERRAASKSSIIELDNTTGQAGAIAHHKLSGVMKLEDSISSYGVNTLISQMRQADADSSVSAHIIEINSGGGQATAGAAMMGAVQDMKKPVYVYGHIVGSAALMAALPADKIILSSNYSRIGSVGAFVSIDKRVAEYMKENVDDIYSTSSNDKNLEWREYLKGNIKPLQKRVTGTAQIFERDVAKFRNLNPDLQESTVRGGMFFGEDAVQRGLADGVGTFQQVLDQLSSEIFHSSNNPVMNLNDFLSGVRTQVNRILGWSLAEDTNAETVLNSLAEAETLEATINTAVTAKLDAIMTELNAQKVAREAADEKVNNLTIELTDIKNQLTNLQDEKVKWNSEKTNLEQQVAELKSGKPIERESDTDVSGTLDVFNKRLTALTVDGESKY